VSVLGAQMVDATFHLLNHASLCEPFYFQTRQLLASGTHVLCVHNP
jgi:hypothetical protein